TGPAVISGRWLSLDARVGCRECRAAARADEEREAGAQEQHADRDDAAADLGTRGGEIVARLAGRAPLAGGAIRDAAVPGITVAVAGVARVDRTRGAGHDDRVAGALAIHGHL